MSDTLPSLDRPKIGSPKIKYTSKAKSKISVTSAAEHSSSEDSDSRQGIAMGDSREEASLAKSTATLPKVEVSLPEPSHHSPPDSKEGRTRSAKPLSKLKGSSSSASLMTPLKDSIRHGSPPIDSVRAKSSDSASPALKTNRPSTPDNDADETSSIAESSVGIRKRRTEPDRIQYFKDQSQCDDFEPHRAHCRNCDKWISLGTSRTYSVRPWEIHRRRCDQWPPVSKDHSGEAEGKKTEGDVSMSQSLMDVIKHPSQLADSEAEVETQKPEGVSLVSESNPGVANEPSPKSSRRNDAERKALFEADPRAQEVKPHEALCRSCQKWIKLGARPYLLGNWNQHQQRCSGVVLSRVATTERKISLLNDPQVKASSSRNVECAFCRTNVELDGVAQYDLTKWYEHKAKCSSPTVQPTPKAPVSRRSRVFLTPSEQTVVHTPTSRVHTPTTSLNSMSINDGSLPRIGEKRTRDEEETPEDRPVNRPRTDTYEAPKNEAPGPWGWFMQPLRAFVRGFREGLGTPST